MISDDKKTVEIPEGHHFCMITWEEGDPCHPVIMCSSTPAEAYHALGHVRRFINNNMDENGEIHLDEVVGHA